MKTLILAALLLPSLALAQPAPDVVQDVINDWQAQNLTTIHTSRSIQALIEAFKAAQTQMADLTKAKADLEAQLRALKPVETP